MERITKLLIYSFCALGPFLARGQFGNEWINYNQQYFEIKIVEDDFYRITRSELEAAGFPIGTIDPDRIQLFREGNEVAIFVSDPGNSFEYLEFYGKGIDGENDASLFESGDQINPYYNLFTDTATYFLTYTLSAQDNGLRMGFSQDGDLTGLSPLEYHIAEQIQVYTSNYADGTRFGSGANFTEAKYDNGEGWTGPFFSKNGFTNHNFTLANYVDGSPVTCDIGLTGGTSLAHNANLFAGPDESSLTLVSNLQFSGWGGIQGSFTIPAGNIGSDGALTIQAFRQGLPDVTERFAVSFVRVAYQQEVSVNSGQNKQFTLPELGANRAYLRVSTPNPESFSVYDVTNEFEPIRLAASGFPDRFDLVVPNAAEGHKVLAVSSPSSVESIQATTLVEPNISGKNYLIITHPDLRLNNDPVQAYANYRQSEAGGNLEVEVVEIDQIYQQFNFGDPSPLALRRLIQYAANNTSLGHVFIIGKGYTPEFDFFRSPKPDTVHIPPFGKPGSDLMFTLGINSGADVPGVPIGRLNAFNPEDVTSYLNKVVEMEAAPFDDLRRKDFLQLSGGNNTSELNAFAGYIEEFTEVLVQDFIGGRAFNTGKETREAVEFIDVTGAVNDGVGYVTFFGHSGGNSTDIEIGRVSDANFGFANKGRYPIFLVNGCNAGDIFGNNFTFGEDWMITPDLGSIAFMANASTAGSNTLRRWSNIYYSTAFGNDVFIERTLGEVIIEVSRLYVDQSGTSRINLSQVQQMLLQGDPAVRVFGANNPDYVIEATDIIPTATEGREILATQESFEVRVVIRNPGRTVADSLFVQLERELSNGSTLDYFLKVPRILRQDTIVFELPNDPTNLNTGLNTFTVIVDPVNETEEFDETNNSASISLTIFDGSTSHLLPVDNGIVDSFTVDLVWQASNLLEGERNYDIEVDTRVSFDSPSKQSFLSSANLVGRQSLNLESFSAEDTVTFYWRSRFTDPGPDESGDWVTSSFTVIDNVTSGWGVYDSGQIQNQDIRGVKLNPSSNSWEFIQSSIPVEIFTFGADSELQYEDLRAEVAGIDFMVTSTDELCDSLASIGVIAFDRESSDPYRPINTGVPDIDNDEVCGRLPQRIYNFNENALLVNRRLQVLIDNMRDGDQIMIYSIGDVTYSNWDAALISTMNSVGISSSTISGLTDGQPIIFYGQKGATPGTAIELINDGSANPLRQQSLTIQEFANGSFTTGFFNSNRIGPARDWSSYSFNISEDLNDTYSLDVVGIGPDGTRVDLDELQRGRSETIDVSSLDATMYPFLELEFSFEDETDLTPPQLNFWQLDFDLPPDGILIPFEKTAGSFQEGQAIERSFGFHNYTSEDFADSLDVTVRFINPASGEVQENVLRVEGPAAGDTTVFSTTFSSLEFMGNNSISVVVSPNENEAYDFNNQLFLTDVVQIEADELNPVLDVTFDGIRILDGDVVSPTPSISIRVRDTNPFLFKSDTSGMNISLRLPGENSQFQRINFSSPELSFSTASESEDFEVTYEPGTLENGIYGLRVQAQDESGNNAGTEPYEVSFEVINESTITHFYPYPNPFSTSCRFVFTLTGTEIPDEIKIQILTVSGRVVREITQEEIGPIRAGNNITEYAWDGRDEFGDQLANGVYFYKVFVNSGGRAINQRATVADKAFKNGFGKLYILR